MSDFEAKLVPEKAENIYIGKEIELNTMISEVQGVVLGKYVVKRLMRLTDGCVYVVADKLE